MSEQEAIDLLRRALAAIWTAIEYDNPSVEDARYDALGIAGEALKLTAGHARRGKDLADDTQGMESWRRFLEKNGHSDA